MSLFFTLAENSKFKRRRDAGRRILALTTQQLDTQLGAHMCGLAPSLKLRRIRIGAPNA